MTFNKNMTQLEEHILSANVLLVSFNIVVPLKWYCYGHG